MVVGGMKGLEVSEIPVPLGSKHPPPKQEVLCSHEFTLGLIGEWLNSP